MVNYDKGEDHALDTPKATREEAEKVLTMYSVNPKVHPWHNESYNLKTKGTNQQPRILSNAPRQGSIHTRHPVNPQVQEQNFLALNKLWLL